MKLKLYGYLIGKDIHFDIVNKRIYRVSLTGSDRNIAFCVAYISDTMTQLLLFLLTHARKDRVTKEELLKKIWEENNLTSSTQRLWHMLNGLNKKLELLGLPGDFIQSSKGRCYMISFNEITPLYYTDVEYDVSQEDCTVE